MSKKTPGSDSMRYEVITQKDNDDILLPIPPALLAKLGWKEGDNIQIGRDSNGKLIFTKKE